MARGTGGRFVAGAGADMAPELVLEKFKNVWKIPVVLGAAGAGGVTTWNTGLSLESMGDQAPLGVKAIMYAAVIGPRNSTASAAWSAAGTGVFQAQVQRGTRVIGDMKAADGDDVVANVFVDDTRAADNAVQSVPLFPMDVLAPEPIMASKLTLLMLNENHARTNSVEWLCQILFGYDPLDPSDVLALQQMALEGA